MKPKLWLKQRDAAGQGGHKLNGQLTATRFERWLSPEGERSREVAGRACPECATARSTEEAPRKGCAEAADCFLSLPTTSSQHSVATPKPQISLSLLLGKTVASRKEVKEVQSRLASKPGNPGNDSASLPFSHYRPAPFSVTAGIRSCVSKQKVS